MSDECLTLEIHAARRGGAGVDGRGYVDRPRAVVSAIGSDESAVAIEVRTKPTASKAARRDGGSDLPLFSARRRMPRQAVPLKKYRCGTSPVSKMSDNEDATAPLGYSKVLSVKNSVGDPIPELPQESEKGSKRPSSIDRQHAGDVLPDQPSGPQSASKVSELDCDLATRSIHSCSETGD
jgi:hypothetical protein